MKNCIALVAFIALFGSLASAFCPTDRVVSRSSALKVAAIDVPTTVQIQQQAVHPQQQQQQSALQGGIQSYVAASTVEDSSTLTLSLKERPPPPTKEELEAKKRNFNLWFWGGGFVAPFLATFYYFGFKFWEK